MLKKIFTIVFLSVVLPVNILLCKEGFDLDDGLQRDIAELNALIERNNYLIEQGKIDDLKFCFGEYSVKHKKPFFEEKTVSSINKILQGLYYKTGVTIYLNLKYTIFSCDYKENPKESFKYYQEKVFKNSRISFKENSRSALMGIWINTCYDVVRNGSIYEQKFYTHPYFNMTFGDDVVECMRDVNDYIDNVGYQLTFDNDPEGTAIQIVKDVSEGFEYCLGGTSVPIAHNFYNSVPISNVQQLNFYDSYIVNKEQEDHFGWIEVRWDPYYWVDKNNNDGTPNLYVGNGLIDLAGLTDQQQQAIVRVIQENNNVGRVFITSTNNFDGYNLVKETFESDEFFNHYNEEYAYWINFDLVNEEIEYEMRVSDKVLALLALARDMSITRFNDVDYLMGFQDAMDFLITNIDNYDKDKPWDLDKLFSSMFHMNNYMSGLVKQAKMPEGMWNPQDTDYDKYEAFHGIDAASKMQAAFTCGFIDALIEEGTGLLELGIMANNVTINKATRESLFNQLAQFIFDDDYQNEVLKELWDKKVEGYTRDFYLGFYNGGRDVEFVLSMFIGLGEIKGALKGGDLFVNFANLPRKFLKVVKELKEAGIIIIDDIIYASKRVSTVIGRVTREGIITLEKGVEPLFTKIDEIIQLSSKDMLLVTPDGRTYRCQPEFERYGDEFRPKLPDNARSVDDLIDFLTDYNLSTEQARKVVNANIVDKIKDNATFFKGSKFKKLANKDAFIDDIIAKSGFLDEIISNNLLDIWVATSKHVGLRSNPKALSKLDEISKRGRGIDYKKLNDVLNGDLGDILACAKGDDLTNILNRMDMDHFIDTHLNEITSRLGNKEYRIKEELLSHPDRFVTFDDVLNDPGKYWDLLNEGSLPNDSFIRNWGQGKWWKDLKEKAGNFEKYNPEIPGSGEARFEFISVNNIPEGKTVDQVTLNIEGISEPIRIDYLGKAADGKYHLGDAKFSTKDKNWAIEWQSAATKNQNKVFPNMKGKNITIKATDPKKIQEIEKAFGIKLKNGKFTINYDQIGSLQILGSAPDDFTSVKQIITLFKQ